MQHDLASCARSPGLLSRFGKISTGFRWPGSSTQSWDLKYGCMSFADWLWVSDCTGARVENDTRPARHKTVHTRASHMPTSPHHTPVTTWVLYAMQYTLREAAKITCDYLGKNTPSSHYTRSGIIAHIVIGLSLPNELITIDRRSIHPWA